MCIRDSFWVGAKDGSAALFTIEQGPLAGNLYRFEVADPANPQLIVGGVDAVAAGAADDLSSAYFASGEVLDPEPNSEGDVAQAGKQNAYRYAEGEGVRFIATLAPALGSTANQLSPFYTPFSGRLGRVSPDGRHLTFASRWAPTGVEDINPEIGARPIHAYRYSADSDELSCVSCNPVGVRAIGGNLPYNGV